VFGSSGVLVMVSSRGASCRNLELASYDRRPAPTRVVPGRTDPKFPRDFVFGTRRYG